MIQVTLEFSNISEAHAALGNMMARMTTVAAADDPGNVVVVPEGSTVEEIAQPEPKPKTKTKRTGRPKGAKDGPGVVRKGTQKAAEGLTIDTLRERLQVFSEKNGFKAARDLLAQYNIKRLPELAEDQFFAFDRDMAKTVEPSA